VSSALANLIFLKSHTNLLSTNPLSSKEQDMSKQEILTQRIQDVRDVTRIQCLCHNWQYDSYMHGMANGLILALALLDCQEPKFLDAPKKWIHKV